MPAPKKIQSVMVPTEKHGAHALRRIEVSSERAASADPSDPEDPGADAVEQPDEQRWEADDEPTIRASWEDPEGPDAR